ncbi:MAG: BMP family ABC transporter substrate-binding protein [Oscillospiraceae bacterium]|jgi:basic membrane protein A|nr:BMP family ABC transporter substrate-binding protein [Oscillospiraceae bacterium]
MTNEPKWILFRRALLLCLAALALAGSLALLPGCKSQPNDPAQPAAAPDANPQKIALLLCDAEMRSASSRGLWATLESYVKEHGGNLRWFAAPTTQDARTVVPAVLAAGYDTIITNNGMLTGYLRETAPDHPDIYFVAMEGFFFEKDHPEQIADCPNLIQGTVRAEESGFLAGYLLAKATKAGTIGLVNGTENPPGFQMEAGFKAGVAYAAEEAGRDVASAVTYVGNGYNRSGGYDAAKELYETAGCDMLFFCAGGETDWGALDAAKDLDKPCLVAGHNGYISPDSVVGETVKNKDPGMKYILSAISTLRNSTDQKAIDSAKAGLADLRTVRLDSPLTGWNKTALSDSFFGQAVLDDAAAVWQKIQSGEISIPQQISLQ